MAGFATAAIQQTMQKHPAQTRKKMLLQNKCRLSEVSQSIMQSLPQYANIYYAWGFHIL
jgi:hypothetical protein